MDLCKYTVQPGDFWLLTRTAQVCYYDFMNAYYRTTITLPNAVYRRIKVQAASQNKSLSRYIADFLSGRGKEKAPEAGTLPFGKYRFGEQKTLSRKTLYESHLRNKISD